MQLPPPAGDRPADALHLTYCTNVHPARGVDEVSAALERHALPLKADLAPDTPFGVGLRLSGAESRELLAGDRLTRFRDFLDAHGFYVFTLNGFPHGAFHGQPVKARVHAPDWRERERVDYTLRLARILAALLPEGAEGSISTSPLSYKAWVDADDPRLWRTLAEHLAEVTEALVRERRRSGRRIHLDLEPEPDGLLETSEELVRFFREWLLTHGARTLASRLGFDPDAAREALLEHVGVCFDTCHVALAFEEPAEVLERLREAGIRVGKVQLSSALEVHWEDDPRANARRAAILERFCEPTYLHQVARRDADGSLRRWPDLPAALAAFAERGRPREAPWRVHFHVPVFVERYDELHSTQATLRRTLEELRARPFSRHLEIETYTWGVLPDDLRRDLTASIAREFRWVLDAVG